MFNPHAVPITVRIHYRHENGSVYTQEVGAPRAGSRSVRRASCRPALVNTVDTAVSASAYATEVYGLNYPGVCERVVYAGTNWTIGHASPGSTAGTHWRFAEGSAAWLFETYFILINQADAPASVTLTYRTAAGAVIGADSLVIPPYLRAAVWANGTVGAQDFTTEVTATQVIAAERVMYRPTGSSLQSAGETSGASPSASSTLSATPPLIEDSGGDPPAPYTLTDGVQGPPKRSPTRLSP